MKYMSVKAYAALVDKSDKTIYKQIQKGTLDSMRVKKGYKVCVDTNLLKRLGRVEQALEEAQAALKAMREHHHEKSQTPGTAAPAPEKNLAERSSRAVSQPN